MTLSRLEKISQPRAQRPGLFLDGRDRLTDLTGATNAVDQTPYLMGLIEDAETLGKARRVKLPAGSIYVNSVAFLTALDLAQNYIFEGDGHGTTFVFGPGLTSKYLLNVNYDAGGAHPAGSSIYKQPQHLLIEGVDFDGTLAVVGGLGASLLRCYRAGTVLRGCRFVNLMYGLDVDGYTDRNTIEEGYWLADLATLPGNYLYRQRSNGDTSTVRKVIFGGNSGGVWLDSAAGFSLVDTIRGRHRFTRCSAVRVADAHEDSNGETVANFIIEDSQVLFESGWKHASAIDVPWITINDDPVALTRPGSQVTIRNSALGYRPEQTNDPRAADIYLQNFGSKSRLRVEASNAPFVYQDGTANLDYGLGLIIKAADATIQAAIDAYPEVFLGGAELRFINSAWEVVPISSGVKPSRSMNAPTITAATSPSFYGGLTSGTTYYYRVATRGRRSMSSIRSSEVSATPSGSNLAVLLTVSPRYSPCVLRVWRGTAAGVYDRYVDIPIDTTSTRLADQGGKIAGYDWITTSVPTPPTANNSLDGLVVPGNHFVGYGTAAPTDTSTAFKAGDVILNTGATGPLGWRCTADGSPGTWTTIGAVVSTLREDSYRRSGVISETIVRTNVATQAITLTSGTLFLYGIPLDAGVIVSNISFYTGTTAGASLSHVWVGLFDLNRVALALSADDTSGSLASNSLITYALSAPFTTTYRGLHYVGIMVAGTTPPTLSGLTGLSTIVGGATAAAPKLNGSADTGLTTPPALPFTAAALTAKNGMAYADVS